MRHAVRVWRDCPKPGETDAGWCYSLALNGHVKHIECGFASEDAAYEAAYNFDAA